MDATSLAEDVRLKKVSPLELVTETIQRARTLNPSLNAIVYEQYEEALEKAKKL
jgi:amidase